MTQTRIKIAKTWKQSGPTMTADAYYFTNRNATVAPDPPAAEVSVYPAKQSLVKPDASGVTYNGDLYPGWTAEGSVGARITYGIRAFITVSGGYPPYTYTISAFDIVNLGGTVVFSTLTGILTGTAANAFAILPANFANDKFYASGTAPQGCTTLMQAYNLGTANYAAYKITFTDSSSATLDRYLNFSLA